MLLLCLKKLELYKLKKKMIKSKTFLPVTFVFHPDWWYQNYGLTFEKDFFYDPDVRIEADRKMRKILFERFGNIGMGEKDPKPRPCIGPTYLAAGYIISEMFGCEIKYYKGASPEVIPKMMSDKQADRIEPVKLKENHAFRKVRRLIDKLKSQFGYVVGDINWQGVLNVALDIRGQAIFIDMIQNPNRARRIFESITQTIIDFVNYIRGETGTSSISVNRAVKYVDPKINLHSNCTVAMISPEMYEKFLLECDVKLSKALQPYGIHHDGPNLHLHADGYAKVPDVCFFDVGWGSDISICRKKLPHAFFNLRYDPVKLRTATQEEIKKDVVRMLKEAGDPHKVGFCCINMGSDTPDESIATIYYTVQEYKKESVQVFS